MKKLQLPSFQWISLSFSSFCCALGRSIRGQLPKKLQFACFSHCRTASFLWFHCAKGTKPNFFRPLPRFPAEFEYIIIYKQMAHGLFSLQFSRFSFALDGFCQNVEKITISIFFPLQQSIIFMISLRPSSISFVHCHNFRRNFNMSLHRNRWHMAYFPCNFQGFPLLWAASVKLLKNCNFHPFNGFFCHFLVFSVLWGAPPRDNCW